ncbi:MAG: hypothetical protein CMO55_16215 [Verrucomicrobiales bacterium]|nr:hypothetical protein [Verrucomicrobiales bacterium]
MEPIAKFFMIFFGGSVVMLTLILVAAMPSVLRACRRTFRQLRARRTRGARMLADLDKLRSDSIALEGVYSFTEKADR